MLVSETVSAERTSTYCTTVYCTGSVNWAVITAAHSALLVSGLGVEEGRGPQS